MHKGIELLWTKSHGDTAGNEKTDELGILAITKDTVGIYLK